MTLTWVSLSLFLTHILSNRNERHTHTKQTQDCLAAIIGQVGVGSLCSYSRSNASHCWPETLLREPGYTVCREVEDLKSLRHHATRANSKPNMPQSTTKSSMTLSFPSVDPHACCTAHIFICKQPNCISKMGAQRSKQANCTHEIHLFLWTVGSFTHSYLFAL